MGKTIIKNKEYKLQTQNDQSSPRGLGKGPWKGALHVRGQLQTHLLRD